MNNGKVLNGQTKAKGYLNEFHRNADLEKNQDADFASIDAMIDTIVQEQQAVAQPVAAPDEPERQRIPRKKMSEGLDVPEREWLMQDWLPSDELTIFAGRGGVGKSRLALQVAGKIATGWVGRPWQAKHERPDAKHAQKKNVLIASWEDDINEIKRRVISQDEGLGFMPYEQVRENVEVVEMHGKGPMWREGLLPAGEDVLFNAEEIGAALLVIDPSAAAFGGNENDRASVRQYMSHLSEWAKRKKCAILILMHPPKYTNADYSGSTDWEGSARAMWKLEKAKNADEEIYHLHVTKSNYLKYWPQEAYLSTGKGGAWRESDYTPGKGIESQILEVLEKEDSLSVRDINKHVTGSTKRIAEIRDTLVESGRLKMEKHGNKQLYTIA